MTILRRLKSDMVFTIVFAILSILMNLITYIVIRIVPVANEVFGSFIESPNQYLLLSCILSFNAAMIAVFSIDVAESWNEYKKIRFESQ